MDFKIFIMIPALVIMLITLTPLLDTVAGELFTELDNTSSVYFVSLIKLIVASFAFILVLGLIVKIVRGFESPPQATFYDWS